MEIGIISLISLLILLICNIPIAFSLIFISFIGLSLIVGISASMSTLLSVCWSTLTSYDLIAIPMFIAMGQFMAAAGIGESLYKATFKWFGFFRGGMAVATVWGCAALGACTGSSSTGIMTFGPVAFKPMQKLGYSKSLILGSICAGSTLGSIIPPSITLVVLGIMTEESIGQLFIAGFFPGLLEAVLYSLLIILLSSSGIWKGPKGAHFSIKEKLLSIPNFWPLVVIFTIVLGGIYSGFFTVTEASAIACLVSFFMLVMLKGFKWNEIIKPSLLESLSITSMMFFLLSGSYYFAKLIGISGVQSWFDNFILMSSLSPQAVLLILLVLMFIFGFFMPSLPIILIMVPIIYPVIIKLGYSGIWFCIILVIVMELAAITPPVGINLFITQGVFKNEASLSDIYTGCLAFVGADVVRLALVIIFPGICLFLLN